MSQTRTLPCAGDVHLWRVQLNRDGASYRSKCNDLSTDEQERCARFVRDELQRRYVNTRWALRRLLADYLDCAPQAVRFRYGPRGKPAVACPADSGLRFSVTHSSELALIACTTQADIGVDVEQVRELPFWLDVARRYFSEKELALVEAQPLAERIRCFLQIWTFKEAYGKALGEGVGTALHGVRSFTGANGKLFAIAHVRVHTMAHAPRIESLALGDEYVAAYSIVGMPVAASVRVLDAA